MRWTPHVTVATVIERDKCFLCVEEQAHGLRVFNQPAGHWEEHETLIEAAQRETLEETGWHVAIDSLTGVYQWRHPSQQDTFLRLCFAAKCLHHDAARPLDPAIIATHWLSRDALLALQPHWRSPMVIRCVDDYLTGRRYPLDLLHALNS